MKPINKVGGVEGRIPPPKCKFRLVILILLLLFNLPAITQTEEGEISLQFPFSIERYQEELAKGRSLPNDLFELYKQGLDALSQGKFERAGDDFMKILLTATDDPTKYDERERWGAWEKAAKDNEGVKESTYLYSLSLYLRAMELEQNSPSQSYYLLQVKNWLKRLRKLEPNHFSALSLIALIESDRSETEEMISTPKMIMKEQEAKFPIEPPHLEHIPTINIGRVEGGIPSPKSLKAEERSPSLAEKEEVEESELSLTSVSKPALKKVEPSKPLEIRAKIIESEGEVKPLLVESISGIQTLIPKMVGEKIEIESLLKEVIKVKVREIKPALRSTIGKEIISAPLRDKLTEPVKIDRKDNLENPPLKSVEKSVIYPLWSDEFLSSLTSKGTRDTLASKEYIIRYALRVGSGELSPPIGEEKRSYPTRMRKTIQPLPKSRAISPLLAEKKDIPSLIGDKLSQIEDSFPNPFIPEQITSPLPLKERTIFEVEAEKERTPAKLMTSNILLIEQIFENEILLAGRNEKYSIIITNYTGQGLSQIVIKAELPNDVFFMSSDPLPSAVVGRNIFWSLGNLASGDKIEISAIIKVDPRIDREGIVNTISVESISKEGNLASNKNSASAAIEIPKSKLEVKKKALSNSYHPGDGIVYIITLINRGRQHIHNISVSDILSKDILFVEDNSDDRASRRIIPDTPEPEQMIILWNIPLLPKGKEIEIRIKGRIKGDTSPGKVVNSLEVRGFDERGDKVTANTSADIEISSK